MTTKNEIVFVFGSNLAGRHGAGAALEAYKNWGAIKGVGVGLQGNSYAIPTKDAAINTLPLNDIALAVRAFIVFAKANSEKIFIVTGIGTGLAGYLPDEIAPLFFGVPDNVYITGKFFNV